MKKILVVFSVLLLTILVSCDKKDSCIDKGGKFNETTKKCEIDLSSDKEETKTNTGKVEKQEKVIEKTNSGETQIEENTISTGTTQTTSTGNLETNKTTTMKKQLQNGDVVAIMTTNKGKITIFLDIKNAPITTANFIGLAKKGYYNGIIFHRVIKDFMIQGGDPDGTGMGGESLYGNKFADEFSPELKNDKFTISMANAGPNTNGSQFFINVVNNNHLNGKHSVFGEVVDGNDNVLSISKVKTGAENKPEKEVKIIKLEIKQFENGSYKEYDFSEEKAKKDYEEYLSNLDKIKKEQEEKKKEEERKRLEAKKDLKIKNGNVVLIDFTLKEENGKELGSSKNEVKIEEKPELMKGLVDGLRGMKLWEKKTITLTPEIGFGEYREDLKKEVPKANLAQFEAYGIKLEAGLNTPFGKILEVKEDSVLLDMNNPYAGKTIIIDFEVKDIN